MTDMRDDLLDQVVDELRALPPVDEAAVRRIVRAAASDAEGVRAGAAYLPTAAGSIHGGSWWRSRVPLAAAAGIALAAGLTGYVTRDLVDRDSATPTAVVASSGREPAAFASAARVARAADQPVPTQFVLAAPRAAHVALVGDFNDWNTTAAPLARDSASGIWTVTVPLPPGRHVYAFMVDGKTLTLDPRAPTAQDPEFGTPSSVVLVGTP